MKSGQGAASRARDKPAAAGGGAPLRLDMRIRDFGPIKKGSISLRPLTILIGPNNTGKSYAAMLAHTIITASAARPGAPSRPPAFPAAGPWAGSLGTCAACCMRWRRARRSGALRPRHP